MEFEIHVGCNTSRVNELKGSMNLHQNPNTGDQILKMLGFQGKYGLKLLLLIQGVITRIVCLM